MATQITIPNKSSGDTILSSDFNTTKDAVNTNATELDSTTALAGTNSTSKVEKASNINKQTASYSVQESDNNNIIECDGTFTVTFGNSLSAGFSCIVVNAGTGTITIAAATVNGKTSVDTQYTSAVVYQTSANSFISL